MVPWNGCLWTERALFINQKNRTRPVLMLSPPESEACPGLDLWCGATRTQPPPRPRLRSMHHFLSLFWLAALLGGTIIFLFLQFKTNRQPVPAKIAGVTSATRTCFFLSVARPKKCSILFNHTCWLPHGFKIFWWLVGTTSSSDLHPNGNISLSIKICSKLNNI